MSSGIRRIKIKRKGTFKLIQRGVKWLEIRLARGFFTNIELGTVIELYNGTNSLIVTVVNKDIYNSMDELLKNRIVRIGSTPLIRDEEIYKYYNQFYSERALKKYKVVVLKIQLGI